MYSKVPLRKLGEGGAYQCHYMEAVGDTPWLCAWEAAPWAGNSPALCWVYLTEWGALGSGSECPPSMKINLLTTSSYCTRTPLKSLALHRNAHQSFQNQGQSTAPKRLGQLQGENTLLMEGKKKSGKSTYINFYEWFVQLSILKRSKFTCFSAG